MKKVGIIGAGIGGIATAIRLRAKGYEVEVFEKNPGPGGKIGELRQGDFRFDTGPSLFTMPELVTELFTLCGEKAEDHFQYRSLPVVCRYHYPDGTVLDSRSDPQSFATEAQKVLQEPPENLHRYLDRSRELYELTSNVFIYSPFRSRKTMMGEEARQIAKKPGVLDAFASLHKRNRKSFSHPHLVQLFDRYATYNGSNPYKAPATLKIIAHLEHNIGAFFPEKGMYAIVESLSRLAERQGVHFHYNTYVEEVKLQKKGNYTLSINGEDSAFNYLISDVDVYTFYKDLLKNTGIPLNVQISGRSTSALIFYWGMQGTYPNLDVHNILFTGNYREEFRHLFRKKTLYADPTVYIFISGKQVKGDAPEGGENWFVMINVPENNGQNWDQFTTEAREHIERKIQAQTGIDVAKHRLSESVNDPRSIEEYTGSYKGSLYGAHSNSAFSAFLRHMNRHRKYQNLFFTGGSVHPGGGIPLCLASAKIVANYFEAL